MSEVSEEVLFSFVMDVPQKLLGILSIQQISTFESLPGHVEKVRYALQLLKENKLATKVGARQSKSNAVASTLRQHGNKFYAAKMYTQAMEFYNKSICFAYERSEELGFSYANRSAVYNKWEMFDKCLENIQMARENCYPSRLSDKLAKREEMCWAATKPVYKTYPSLSHPENCLKILENKIYGRHAVANRDLKVGDIVVVEPTYQTILHKEYNYRRCANCLAENDLSLIPCPVCTLTMFCSSECLAIAHEKFHNIECPIVEAIAELDTDHQLSLRILLGLIWDFETVETVEILARICDESWTRLRLPDETTNKMEKFEFFHQLQHNVDRLSQEQILRDSVSTALLINLLTEKTELTKVSDKFMHLLFLYFHICRTNSHDVEVLERNTNEILVKPIGKGISLIASLFNHSCAPNARRISPSEGQTAIVVQRPIKSGEQLFVSYGLHHLEWSKQNRQNTLETRYKFSCTCEACTKDYPLLNDLPFNERCPFTLAAMQQYSVEESVTQRGRYEHYLQKYGQSYPSRVYSLMQAAMHRALLAECGNFSINIKR